MSQQDSLISGASNTGISASASFYFIQTRTTPQPQIESGQIASCCLLFAQTCPSFHHGTLNPVRDMLIKMMHGDQRDRIDPNQSHERFSLADRDGDGGEEASSDDMRLGSWEKAARKRQPKAAAAMP